MKRKAGPSPQGINQEPARKKHEGGHEVAERLEATQTLDNLKNSGTQNTTVANRPRNIFRWNDLPGELKNRIYAYALEDDQNIVIRQQGHPGRVAPPSYLPTNYSLWRATDRTLGPRNPNVGLLRASRQIYTEARLFLHLGNTLRFVTVRDFHCWVHHKLPAAVFVRNAALWYVFHGKTLVWEMAIPTNRAGLILTPVVDEDRARTLRETPSVVMHDFLDSLARRYMPPRMVLLFGIAALGGGGGGGYGVGLSYHPPVRRGAAPLVPGYSGNNQPRTDWHVYPTHTRRLVNAHGKVIKLGVDLWSFQIKWERMPHSHVRVRLPVHGP
ncbi:hypothetical protein SLS55_008367 [Diplodia seriata]|uniref:Uncharacterized protein n=1 Tax=Diplodia seriata TaxID=420778 RepID=A0ABR3CA87_9PEZI